MATKMPLILKVIQLPSFLKSGKFKAGEAKN